MKRIYQHPEILITACEVEQLLSASTLPVEPGTTVSESDGGWTKSESDWNIWSE